MLMRPSRLSRSSRTAGGRQADHLRKVCAPGEVIAPAVPARMKQWRHFSTCRIDRLDLVVLEVVAALAGKREVVQCRGTLAASRLDVLHREPLDGVLLGTAAVLAAV